MMVSIVVSIGAFVVWLIASLMWERRKEEVLSDRTGVNFGTIKNLNFRKENIVRFIAKHFFAVTISSFLALFISFKTSVVVFCILVGFWLLVFITFLILGKLNKVRVIGSIIMTDAGPTIPNIGDLARNLDPNLKRMHRLQRILEWASFAGVSAFFAGVWNLQQLSG